MHRQRHQLATCLWCIQGEITAVTEVEGGRVLLVCDECEHAWGCPEDVLLRHHPEVGALGEVALATWSDLQRAGWDRYMWRDAGEATNT